MDDQRPADPDPSFATVATQMHPAFIRIVAEAAEIRQWIARSTDLSDEERAGVLKHLNALEAMAERLSSLTAPTTSQTE